MKGNETVMKRTPLHAKVIERGSCITIPSERRIVYSFKTAFEADYFLRRLRDDQRSSHWSYASRIDDHRVAILKPDSLR